MEEEKAKLNITKIVRSYPGINVKHLPEGMTLGEISKMSQTELVGFKIPYSKKDQFSAEDLINDVKEIERTNGA